MSEIEKYYNGEIIVDFEEETELEKEYNKVAELYSKAVKKKIEYRKEIERLNNKIDKAIEFINDNSHSNIKMNFIDKSGKIKCEFDNNVDPRDLLDILKGDDKE